MLCWAVAGLALIFSVPGMAQDQGTWRAANSTATTTTGDIVIGNSKLVIDLTGFTIASIHRLTTAEASAAFDVDLNAGGSGSLYRLSIPGSRKFLHHNTICGSDDTQWMATYVMGRNLTIVFFSGSAMPVLTLDAMNNASNVCGKFVYAR